MGNFRNIGTDFTDGLQTPHYTNGRLLTAEDLQREQQAALDRLTQLGKGFAAGVIDGFRVSAIGGNKSLQITAGSGINRNGNVVTLSAQSVAFPVQPITDIGTPLRRSARFEDCFADGDQPTSAPLTSGAYLLTVAPVARLEGTTPRQAPSGTETATCANQWEVEGVQFKIIRLDDYQAPTGNRRNRNRNLLAHWFYGSSKLTRLMLDLFDFDPDYTGFATIPPENYAACDLPLAVFFWENNQIAFVDEWAVRRRLSHPYPGRDWKANISDQRIAEGEARFIQFQEHLDNLRSSSGNKTSSIRAVDSFAYLPPVGFLPVNPFELIVDDVFAETVQTMGDNLLARLEAANLSLGQVRDRVRVGVTSSLGSDTVFRLSRFFEDLLPDQYHIVHEDEIHERLQLSWTQPPIPMPAPPSGGIVAQPGFFDLVLADANIVAVTDDNISAVIASMAPSISTTGFSRPITRLSVAREETGPSLEANIRGNRAFLTNFATLIPRRRAVMFNAINAFAAGRNDDEEPEPLVEILVVDELLAPYRAFLARQMPDRIDAAITSLISGGGNVFTGSNEFTAVNNTIYSAFLVNHFLEGALHTGIANINQLKKLTIGTALPPFFVVFVRYRPPRRSRPLRSQ